MNRLTSFLVGGILFLAAAQGLQAQVNFNQIKLGSGGNVLTLVGPSTGSATYSFPVPSGSVAQVLTSSGGQTIDGTVTATVDNAVIAGLRLTPAFNDNGHTGVLHATLALGTDNAAGTMFISDGSATAKYAVLTAPSLASNQTYTLSPAGGSLVTMTGGVSGSQLWNAGDLIYASANGSAVTRLAKGGNNTVLAVDGAGAFGWSGTLPALNG
jgi:hypothetical protein